MSGINFVSFMVLLTMTTVNSSNSIGHIDLWSMDVARYAVFNWCCLTIWCDIPCLLLPIWYEWHFGILKGRLWIYLWVAPSSSHLECRFQQFTWSQPLVRGTTPHHSQCECTEEPQDWGSLDAAPQPVGWFLLLKLHVDCWICNLILNITWGWGTYNLQRQYPQILIHILHAYTHLSLSS